MKPNINSVEVHPQLTYNGHPVDGALVGASSLWPCKLKAFSGQVFTSVEQLLLFDPGNWSGLGPGINNPPVRYCLLKPGKQLTHQVLNFQILITYLDDLGIISIKHVYKRQFRNRKYTYIHIYIYI